MGRWRLTVREQQGRALLILTDKGVTIGMANVTTTDYRELCRTVAHSVMEQLKSTLFTTLQSRLWSDAQKACHDDAEGAKRWLLSFGWSTETITNYVSELAVSVGQALLDKLPEHVV